MSANTRDYLHREAMRAVERGWSLTPCNGKKPRNKRWQNQPRADYNDVERWVKAGRNLAIRTGEVIVVDCDQGADLPEWLTMTVTPIVETGGGGRHFYFRCAPDVTIKNSAGKVAPHIDVRGVNGCAVFPGSCHPETGRMYQWSEGRSPDDISLAELPSEIVEILREKPAQPREDRSNGNGRASKEYLEKALRGEVERVSAAIPSTRNHTLNSAAYSLGRLIAAGLDEQEAARALLSAATAIGLLEAEARATIASALRAGREHPRKLPEAKRRSSRASSKIENQRPLLPNYGLEYEGRAKFRVAYPLPDIRAQLLKITEGWPKRVGNLLFIREARGIRFLSTPESLFACIGEKFDLRWRSGSDEAGITLTPKTEFFQNLRATVEAFEAVEEFPHEPPMPGTFYAWAAPSTYKPDGSHLERLLGFFNNAETPIDGTMIRAMILTPAWGGLPGYRPAFELTGPDRGVGKTSLANMCGELYGGAIDIEPTGGNEDRIVSRLLSDSALTKRVVRVDNVKSPRSSPLLESLVTSFRISGHRLYAGEAARLNTLTFILTGNCLRLSRDLAERSFIIRLRKPQPTPGWSDRLAAFIRNHRDHVLADIVAELGKVPVKHLARDRWQTWLDGVLARCTDDPAAIVALNQQRRDECDEDLDEAQEILVAVADHLKTTTETFISSTKMNEVVNQALSVNWTTKRVANHLKKHIEAGRLPGIERLKTRSARGYEVCAQ
ncbi:MAG: bifunctional DNA primase/polymerase [Candidatus Hydrogenedentes bacterium]|nr:bifunctional DNA primase/polymerase [Candidatus Hydrogenedentota bacterium]